MNFFTIRRHLIKQKFFAIQSFALLVLFAHLQLPVAAQVAVQPKLAVQLLLNTRPGPQNTADGVVTFFDDNFSFSIGNEDSYKWTNLDENLAIIRGGKLLSIEGRPAVHGSDTMSLKMWTFRQKSYFLKFSGSNFAPTLKAVVRDNYLNKESALDLSSSTLVPFSLTADSASFAANRFSVVFKSARVSTLSGAVKFSSVFKQNASITIAPIPVAGNSVTIQLNDMKQGRYEVSLYNSEGQIVYAGFLNHEGTPVTRTISTGRRMHKGSYSLLISNGEQAITKNLLFE